jgi:hypothetical protein
MTHHLAVLGGEPDCDNACGSHKGERDEPHSTLFPFGSPQSVGKGCPDNCHLYRLAESNTLNTGTSQRDVKEGGEYCTGDCAGNFRCPWEGRLGRSSQRTGKPSTRVQEERKKAPTAKAPSLLKLPKPRYPMHGGISRWILAKGNGN